MSYQCVVICGALLFTANSLAATVDANNTVQADRPILTCPVEQASASNGSAPDVELLKKIVRCKKGELAAAKG